MQQQLNIDVESLPTIECPECESIYWTKATKIKKISKLVSPNGQEGFINIPVYICLKCKYPFSPEEN